MRCVTLGGLSEGRGREMMRWPFEVLQAWHTDKSPSRFTQQRAHGTCHYWMTGPAGRDPVGLGSGQLRSETVSGGRVPRAAPSGSPDARTGTAAAPSALGMGLDGHPPEQFRRLVARSDRTEARRQFGAASHVVIVTVLFSCLPRDSVSLCVTLTVSILSAPGSCCVQSPCGTWPASLLTAGRAPRGNVQSGVSALAHGQHTDTSLETSRGPGRRLPGGKYLGVWAPV